ncbi:hypothetical protein QQF64_009302 [Cirrhinus molitorella]|uniref:Uncharacterized protein n=1 Tax=Cirrhinus molitorella TaxID=172907 RepID=A0ABR3M0S8_9TELE
MVTRHLCDTRKLASELARPMSCRWTWMDRKCFHLLELTANFEPTYNLQSSCACCNFPCGLYLQLLGTQGFLELKGYKRRMDVVGRLL